MKIKTWSVSPLRSEPAKVAASLALAAGSLMGAFQNAYALDQSPRLAEALKFEDNLDFYSSAGTASMGSSPSVFLKKFIAPESKEFDANFHKKIMRDAFIPMYGNFCELDDHLRGLAHTKGFDYLGCSVTSATFDNRANHIMSLTADQDASLTKISNTFSLKSIKDEVALQVFGKPPEVTISHVHVPGGALRSVSEKFSYSDAVEITSFAIQNSFPVPSSQKAALINKLVSYDPIVAKWQTQGPDAAQKILEAQQMGAFPGLKEPLTLKDLAVLQRVTKTPLDLKAYNQLAQKLMDTPAYKYIEPLLDQKCDLLIQGTELNLAKLNNVKNCMVRSGIEPNKKTDYLLNLSSANLVANKGSFVVGTFKGSPVLMTLDTLEMTGGAYVLDAVLKNDPSRPNPSDAVSRQLQQTNANGAVPIVLSAHLGNAIPASLKTPENEKNYHHFVLYHEHAHVLQGRHHHQQHKGATPFSPGGVEHNHGHPVESSTEQLDKTEGFADQYAIYSMKNSGRYSNKELHDIKLVTDRTFSALAQYSGAEPQVDKVQLTTSLDSTDKAYEENSDPPHAEDHVISSHRVQRAKIREKAWEDVLSPSSEARFSNDLQSGSATHLILPRSLPSSSLGGPKF